MKRTMMMAAVVASHALAPTMAQAAAGDLLVAPTRLIMGANSGGEVVVNNTGDKATTYRISLVLRKMTEQGTIESVDEATASQRDAAALDLITYAPRKITLAPQQSQTVRIGVRVPPTMPGGEYRAHLLFRAVPDVADAAAPQPAADGMSISLTPIYGVTIPVIVRVGEPKGSASLNNARLSVQEGQAQLDVDLMRAGDRSVYGTLELMQADGKTPIATIKGIAAYPEVAQRHIMLPVDRAALARVSGPLKVRFVETDPAAGGAVSETAVARP
ncbi:MULTISPECIES: DUF916 domain-containing protein [unclassified Sphingobium]|uniref:DUF916 domain-containing protein n=1 Tax=unclassified Sphingobium TaxID=2611147 RepID=UPI001A31C492|nr:MULTISPECIES: DUF916 domain-containing protein [unclassified Sphingobium]MBG6120343.1 P pilus assembly chaperone PapD [Sphingobium sp. JAI105]